MGRLLLAGIGILLFLGSFSLFRSIGYAEQLASGHDASESGYGMIEGPPPCGWTVSAPDKVISEDKSQALVVSVTNETDTTCVSALTLRAPGFEISPAKEEQTVTLPATGSGSLSWILTPRKTGEFEVSVTDILNTQIFGITVLNIFGLTASQAKMFSALGSLFGPMLTIPWWVEKWWNKRKKKQEGENNVQT